LTKGLDSGLILGIGGIVLTIILLVLNKAGKLKGPVLIGLVVLAGAMTLPLALKNPFVVDITDPWKSWTQAFAVAIICFTFWASESGFRQENNPHRRNQNKKANGKFPIRWDSSLRRAMPNIQSAPH